MKQKIIFLDFDGVLNSVRSAIADGHYITTLNAKNSILMGTPTSGFDRIAVNLIHSLMKRTGAYIVVSSAWRKTFSLRDIREIFHNEFGWSHEEVTESIIGVTGISDSQSRGDEIQNWIDEHTVGINNFQYIIIDDGYDFHDHQYKRLVQTDPYEGFLYKDYVKALGLFGLERDVDAEWL